MARGEQIPVAGWTTYRALRRDLERDVRTVKPGIVTECRTDEEILREATGRLTGEWTLAELHCELRRALRLPRGRRSAW